MQKTAFALAAACALGGCATTSNANLATLPDKDTGTLCRIAAENPDEAHRSAAADLLARRGATPQKCAQIMQSDQAMFAAAIGVSAVALTAAASDGAYYPSYPTYGSYGVAWDQFYNQNYQLIWRCRDAATGRFVEDSYCSGKPMVDATWPGWSA